MAEETIKQRILELEDIWRSSAPRRQRHKALLDLAILHLTNPTLDLNGCTWTGHQLRTLSDDFFCGRTASIFRIKPADRRTANMYTRDELGLTKMARIVLEVQSQRNLSKLRGYDVYCRVGAMKVINLGGETVKRRYYQAMQSPDVIHELRDFRAKLGILNLGRSLRK